MRSHLSTPFAFASLSSPVLRALGAALALSLALGCSGAEATDDTESGALTADQINAEQHDLRERVLSGFSARSESKESLGIVKWDVFAGIDAKTGFKGSVFYASDANGDVKYAFSVDVAKNATALLRLDRDGKVAANKIDEETAKKLLAEIEFLRAGLDGSRASHCGRMLAWGGMTAVLGAGVVVIVGAVVAFGAEIAVGVGALASVTGAVGATEAAVGIMTAAGALTSFAGYTTVLVAWVNPTIDKVRLDTARCISG